MYNYMYAKVIAKRKYEIYCFFSVNNIKVSVVVRPWRNMLSTFLFNNMIINSNFIFSVNMSTSWFHINCIEMSEQVYKIGLLVDHPSYSWVCCNCGIAKN